MEKVRFAVIGIAPKGIGNHHINGIKNNPDKAELVAVCDIVEDFAKLAASKYNVDRWYTDYRKMLKDFPSPQSAVTQLIS